MLSRQCVIENESENHRGLEIVQINAFIWMFAVESAKPFHFNESTLQHTAIMIKYRSCEYMCIGEKTTVMHTHFPLFVRFHSRFYIYIHIYRHCVTCCVSSSVCVNNYLAHTYTLTLTSSSFNQFTDELFKSSWWWWWRQRCTRISFCCCMHIPSRTHALSFKCNKIHEQKSKKIERMIATESETQNENEIKTNNSYNWCVCACF